MPETVDNNEEKKYVMKFIKGGKILDISINTDGVFCITLDNGKEFDLVPGSFCSGITVYDTVSEDEIATAHL